MARDFDCVKPAFTNCAVCGKKIKGGYFVLDQNRQYIPVCESCKKGKKWRAD